MRKVKCFDTFILNINKKQFNSMDVSSCRRSCVDEIFVRDFLTVNDIRLILNNESCHIFNRLLLITNTLEEYIKLF